MTQQMNQGHGARVDDRSVSELVNELSTQVSRLVRDELKLAQYELVGKAKRFGVGAGLAGAAGVLAWFGDAADPGASYRERQGGCRRGEGTDALMSRSENDRPRFPANVEEARTDIELTREELGDTVEALAHKVNVRERAGEVWQEKTEPVREKAQHAVDRAREVTPEPVVQSAASVVEVVRKRPGPVLIGAGAAIIAGWLMAGRRK